MTGDATQTDWAAVATAVAPGLLRLAVMLTGSRPDAEDLLQTTFLRAQRHAARVAKMAAPAAYLRRIMLNEHASTGRRLRLRTVPLTEATTADTADIARTADTDHPVETDHGVWTWLATLPRQQRAVLVLRFYEDLPDGEIADLVGCSPATVRSHASRGLAALRTLLTADHEEFR